MLPSQEEKQVKTAKKKRKYTYYCNNCDKSNTSGKHKKRKENVRAAYKYVYIRYIYTRNAVFFGGCNT